MTSWVTCVCGVTFTGAGAGDPVSVMVLPETDPTMPATRSLAGAAAAELDGAGDDDALEDEDEDEDEADGVLDDPQAASVAAVRPARATALHRDARVEVNMSFTVRDGPVRAL